MLGREGLQRAAAAMVKGDAIDPAGVKLLAPVPRPEKIFCIGLNYADHARETGKEPPPEPVVFSKFVTAVRGPGEAIVLPRLSQQVDFEAELVAVIGQGGRHIPVDRALAHVAGYTCGNDVSARLAKSEAGPAMAAGKIVRQFCAAGSRVSDGRRSGRCERFTNSIADRWTNDARQPHLAIDFWRGAVDQLHLGRVHVESG